MGKYSNSRMLLPDVLKGAAVLLMIQVHLMELFAKQEIYDGFWGRISLFLGGPPAAPVFMAVMGYFLLKQEAGSWNLVTRGARLILYGLLLNLGMNMNLFYHMLTGEIATDPLSYIFGVDILFLAGMSVIAISVFRMIFAESVFWWVLLTLFVASAALFLPSGNTDQGWLNYLLPFIYKETWWSYFPLFPWLAYPLAGYSFHLISNKYFTGEMPSGRILLVGIAMLVPILFTFSYGFNITTNLAAYYHHATTYFLWTMAFLGVWVIAFRFLVHAIPDHFAIRYLQWTGTNVTSFYVIQWLIIGNLATAIYKSVSAVQLLFWFAGISVTTSFLVWMVRFVREKYRNTKELVLR